MDDLLEQYSKQLGVLVTSHPKQHIWMHQAFASWAGYSGFMLLGYDNCDTHHLPLHDFMPPVNETFVTGHCAGELGHYRGELWQMKLGGQILAERGFKYIYKTAADNCCYRWRNLKRIFKVMHGKHYDMILCGTTQIFAKLDIFNRCMELWSDEIKKCGGAECFLNHRIKDLAVRDCRMKIGWWNEILGLIHLQGEYAVNNELSIFDTWVIGQKWGCRYSHRDLEPRIKYLKPEIREIYESTISKKPEDS